MRNICPNVVARQLHTQSLRRSPLTPLYQSFTHHSFPSLHPSLLVRHSSSHTADTDVDPNSDHPDAPVDSVFAYPFGLQDVDAPIASYRASLASPSSSPLAPTSTPTRHGSGAVAALRELKTMISTEEHAAELEASLRGKMNATSKGLTATRGLAASHSNERLKAWASRVDLLEAKIQRMEVNQMQLEKIEKSIVIYPPTPNNNADTSTNTEDSSNAAASIPGLSPDLPLSHGIRLHVDWSTSRHAARKELAPTRFHLRIQATPFNLVQQQGSDTSDADQGQEPEDDTAIASWEQQDLPSVVLLDISDGDSSRVHLDRLASLRVLYGGVTPDSVAHSHSHPEPHTDPFIGREAVRDWSWFLAFICSHPTDLCFDELSNYLLQDR